MSTRSLILGNVSLKPNRAAIEVAFGSHGLLEAVRTFPGKPYAIVHFFQPQHAAQAAASLDGVPVASISGSIAVLPCVVAIVERCVSRPVKKAEVYSIESCKYLRIVSCKAHIARHQARFDSLILMCSDREDIKCFTCASLSSHQRASAAPR